MAHAILLRIPVATLRTTATSRGASVAVVVLAGVLVAAVARAQNPVAVSVSTAGAPANGASGHGTITPDGRFVAFESVASNLVSGDTNAARDVFVRDRQLGTTTRVSVASDATERQAPGGVPIVDDARITVGDQPISISHDGRFVAFTSRAVFVPADPGSGDDV